MHDQPARPPAAAGSAIPLRFAGPREFLAEYQRTLSKGGIFIATEKPAAFGTSIALSLELPGTETVIPILGQVAAVVTAGPGKTAGMGIRFGRLDPASEQVLRSFVHGLQALGAGRVLIVDDDALVLAQMSDALKPAGFTVVALQSAIKALDAMKYQAFDLILSDVNMPRMDGFEFRDNLRSDPKTQGIPFCFITSSPDEESRATALKLGARAFVAKPVDAAQLVAFARTAVAEYAAASSSSNSAPSAAARQAGGKSTAGVRERRIVEIAFRKMTALGLKPRFTADEKSAFADIKFRYVAITHISTRARIPGGRLRSVEHDKVRFDAPPHLANLPAFPILDLPDAASFERVVAKAYADRSDRQARAKVFFDRYKIRNELDEPGFRVVGRVKIGTDEVTFSVHDEKTVLLESLNGRHFGPVMGETARLIDIADATSGVDVEIELETVLRQYRPELERMVAAAAKTTSDRVRAIAGDAPMQDLSAPDENVDMPRSAPAPRSVPEPEPPASGVGPEEYAGNLELIADVEPEEEPLLLEADPEPADLATGDIEAMPLESLDVAADLMTGDIESLPLEEDSVEAIPDEPEPESPEPTPLQPTPLLEGTTLICNSCGKTYAIGDEIEDERLLLVCPNCL